MGSYHDNETVPKCGDKIWIVPPYREPNSGVVDSVIPSDYLCCGRVTLTGGRSAPLNRAFDHEPRLVEKEDEYGTFTQWE